MLGTMTLNQELKPQGQHLLLWKELHPETEERLHGKFRIHWTFKKTIPEQPITLD